MILHKMGKNTFPDIPTHRLSQKLLPKGGAQRSQWHLVLFNFASGSRERVKLSSRLSHALSQASAFPPDAAKWDGQRRDPFTAQAKRRNRNLGESFGMGRWQAGGRVGQLSSPWELGGKGGMVRKGREGEEGSGQVEKDEIMIVVMF